MQRSLWWTIWMTSTVLLLPMPLEAAIEYVVQESERSTRQDGSQMSSAIWVEVNPQVSGMTLALPPWTLFYHGERYDLPATSFTLKAHPTEPTQVTLYLVPGTKGAAYVLIDSQDPEPLASYQATIQAQAATEAVAIAWGDLPPGTTTLNTVTIYVLRHVQA